MTLSEQLALATGALAGLGVVVVVLALWPRGPRLASVIDVLSGGDGTTAATPSTASIRSVRSGEWVAGIGRRVLRRWPELPRVRVPYADLALLGIPVARYIGERVVAAVLGWLLTALVLLSGGPVTGMVGLLVIGPLIGLAVSFVPDRLIVRRARRAREDFRMGLSAFADLASLYIATGVGPMQALQSAAELGDSWVFARLAEELRRAEFAQSAAWDALRRVGEELNVPLLADVADILRLSAENSVTIGAGLQTRAHSMRHQLLTEEHERANAASERLSAPVSGLVFVFLGMLVTPAILSLLP